jgi:hypothetical protein
MSGWQRFSQEGKGLKPQIIFRGPKNKGFTQIAFNSKAIDKFKLKRYRFIVLFINPDEKKIGLKLTNDSQEKGLRNLRKSKGGVSVSATAFVKEYNLNNLKESKLNCELDNTDGMIVAKYEYK